MGSLAAHFSAFLFLFPVGIRRLLYCFSLHLKNPSLYRSKTWYFSNPKWKTLDLLTLLVALPIASFSEMFLFLTFSGHPSYKFAYFQQSAVVFIFWVVLILVVLREFLDPFVINESFVFIFAGISFLIDYAMTGKEITGSSNTVPSVRIFELLAQLTLLCGASCFYLSVKPRAFVADLVLCLGIIFKGTWVLQAGLSMYLEPFLLKGCHKILIPYGTEGINLQCDLEEDGLRGVALINLLFVGHGILVLVLCFVVFGALARNVNWRFGEGNNNNNNCLLAEIGSESLLVHSLPELEIE